MDLDDILEVIENVLSFIGIILLTALAGLVLVYCFLGWLLPIIAFFNGKISLGIGLLIVWMIVSNVRISI